MPDTYTLPGVPHTAATDAEMILESVLNATPATLLPLSEGLSALVPDANGRFGAHGGRFVPETLIPALDELAAEYEKAKADPEFQRELDGYLRDFVGRATPLYYAERLSQLYNAKIYVKREDLCHTGAHKINNTMGQILLARRMGKPRIIAETGAGQHGVATATVCARFGLECDVYMGEEDVHRQSLNVSRMKLMGARVITVTSGTKTLKDATNEAMRDWVTHVRNTHYIIGSVVGPHPYPMLVRDFQSVIGREAREQILHREGRLPDYVLACVGGGSNAMGIFYPFVQDTDVKLIGIEGGGVGHRNRAALRPPDGGNSGRVSGFGQLSDTGRGRAGRALALHFRRTGLPRRRAGTQLFEGHAAGAVRGRDRQRRAERPAMASPQRGHYHGLWKPPTPSPIWKRCRRKTCSRPKPS